MAKYLDLTGLTHFKDKILTAVGNAYRKKTDKVLSTDVTYSGKTLDEAIKSGEFKGEKGDAGAKGATGATGANGKDGVTPSIGSNGNWFLGSEDTGKPSRGATGAAGPTGKTGPQGPAGPQGPPGSDANVQSISNSEIDTLFT